ncbi:hypothetical protein [Streptomyces sp. NBC_01477]|uniref:hypothetical protein n=1 Tax=Streptomyces sp. NBC_01477 TaxID=2976015 RepID=UPI002E36B106|nr:hypothetical protein [Streptomyces sp. NBC_01477]
MRRIVRTAVSLAAAALFTAGTAGIAAADDGPGLSGSATCGSGAALIGSVIPIGSPEQNSGCNVSGVLTDSPAPASDD